LHLFLLCGWLFRTPSLSAGWLSVKRVGGGFPFSAFLIILGFWFCNFANTERTTFRLSFRCLVRKLTGVTGDISISPSKNAVLAKVDALAVFDCL
jgi:hypothetical protein